MLLLGLRVSRSMDEVVMYLNDSNWFEAARLKGARLEKLCASGRYARKRKETVKLDGRRAAGEGSQLHMFCTYGQEPNVNKLSAQRNQVRPGKRLLPCRKCKLPHSLIAFKNYMPISEIFHLTSHICVPCLIVAITYSIRRTVVTLST